MESAEELYRRRVTRILVEEFPMYFAVVTQLRRDTEVLGEVGGVINSTVEPRVEAVIPHRAFRKNVRLSLQVTYGKVKFSHARFLALGPELIPVCSLADVPCLKANIH